MMTLFEYEIEQMRLDKMQENYELARSAYIKEKSKTMDWESFLDCLGDVGANAMDVKLHQTWGGESRYNDPEFANLFEAYGHYVVNPGTRSREILGNALVNFIESRLAMEFEYTHEIENFAE